MAESDIVATVGLISDTHGWLHPFIHEAFADCDLIIHAGDIGTPDVLTELESIAPIAPVKGNIDGGDLRFLPLERVEDVAGTRIAVLHIAGSPRSPKPAARDLIRREKPDVIIVGHSHIPVIGKVSDTIWVNPGAAGRYGHHLERTAARLHIRANGELGMDRILLGMRWEEPE